MPSCPCCRFDVRTKDNLDRTTTELQDFHAQLLLEMDLRSLELIQKDTSQVLADLGVLQYRLRMNDHRRLRCHARTMIEDEIRKFMLDWYNTRR